MAKSKTQFLCNKCGSVHPKWMGKCPDCGTWDSLEEYKTPTFDARAERAAAAGADRRSSPAAPKRSRSIEIDEADAPRLAHRHRRIRPHPRRRRRARLGRPHRRRPGHREVDAAAASGARNCRDDRNRPADAIKRPTKVLYVTSEESARQTGLRAARLGVAVQRPARPRRDQRRADHQPDPQGPAAVVIVDSIQMIYKPDLPAAPGSVTQLRDCCMDLVYLAKASGIAILFVGHVTKAGTLAGPKIIEHIVDTVVYFEGDRFHSHRIVRCIKNRFGSTHEVGLFEMTGEGLREVTDPGNLFVEQYGPGGPPSGSVITAAMQGSRVLLVEVQALTASSVIGAAKRKVSGVSSDRVAMIIAVLEKRAELRLAADDVFVNVAGGVKVAEPAIDLAIALAIASAHMNRPLPAGTFAVGELGLGGEIRSVPQLETPPARSRPPRARPRDRPPHGRRQYPQTRRHGAARSAAVVAGDGDDVTNVSGFITETQRHRETHA